MKNLFERLKPEHKITLDQKFNPYPHTKQTFENGLKNKRYISDLEFETVTRLSEVLGISKVSFSDIYDMFEH